MLEGLLLGAGFIGVFLTVLTKYIKTGLAITLASVGGYIYFADLNSWIPIIFLVLGLLCFVFELFIPDFGILGIIGVLLLLGGLYAVSEDFVAAISDLALAVIVAGAILFFLVKSGAIKTKASQFVLQANSKEANDREETVETNRLVLGQEGIVTAPLRLTGKARFSFPDGSYREVEVTSEHEALDPGTTVKITAIRGNKIIIRGVPHG